jgi:hypothetical protein
MKKTSKTFGRGLMVLALLAFGLGLASCGGGGSEEPKTNAGAGTVQSTKATPAAPQWAKLDEEAKRKMEKDCFAIMERIMLSQVALETAPEYNFGYQISDITGVERLALMGFEPIPDVAFNVQLAGANEAGENGFVTFAGHITQGSPIHFIYKDKPGSDKRGVLEATSVMPSGVKIPSALTVFEVTTSWADYNPKAAATIVKTCQVNGVTVGACTTP